VQVHDDVMLRQFEEGIEDYLAGDWRRARNALTRFLKQVPGDGPAECILGFMKARGFQRPSNWPGFRELTSK
jgi:hypothetical protein